MPIPAVVGRVNGWIACAAHPANSARASSVRQRRAITVAASRARRPNPVTANGWRGMRRRGRSRSSVRTSNRLTNGANSRRHASPSGHRARPRFHRYHDAARPRGRRRADVRTPLQPIASAGPRPRAPTTSRKATRRRTDGSRSRRRGAGRAVLAHGYALPRRHLPRLRRDER